MVVYPERPADELQCGQGSLHMSLPDVDDVGRQLTAISTRVLFTHLNSRQVDPNHTVLARYSAQEIDDMSDAQVERVLAKYNLMDLGQGLSPREQLRVHTYAPRNEPLDLDSYPLIDIPGDTELRAQIRADNDRTVADVGDVEPIVVDQSSGRDTFHAYELADYRALANAPQPMYANSQHIDVEYNEYGNPVYHGKGTFDFTEETQALARHFKDLYTFVFTMLFSEDDYIMDQRNIGTGDYLPQVNPDAIELVNTMLDKIVLSLRSGADPLQPQLEYPGNALLPLQCMVQILALFDRNMHPFDEPQPEPYTLPFWEDLEEESYITQQVVQVWYEEYNAKNPDHKLGFFNGSRGVRRMYRAISEYGDKIRSALVWLMNNLCEYPDTVEAVGELTYRNSQDILHRQKANFPLIVAGSEGKPRGVELLLRHGANPNIRFTPLDDDDAVTVSDTRITPLQVAVKQSSVKLIKILLANGADLSSGKSMDGLSALAVALSCGYLDAADILIEHGATLTREDAILALKNAVHYFDTHSWANNQDETLYKIILLTPREQQ